MGMISFYDSHMHTILKKMVGRCDKPLSKEILEAHLSLIKHYKAEEVSFKTDDNIMLSGLLIVRPGAHRTVMVCHGYRQVKEMLTPFVDMLPQDNIFLFDFRAHGGSEGNNISFGYHEATDVWAAVTFLTSNPKTKDIPLYGLGFSMGTAALLKAAYEGAPFKALVLDSPFADFYALACTLFTRMTKLPIWMVHFTRPVFEIMINARVSQLNTTQFIAALKIPIFITHSETDQFIPVTHGKTLYEYASGKKDLWIVKNCRHGGIIKTYPREYKTHIHIFFESASQY
jgi:uncharacterized protein